MSRLPRLHSSPERGFAPASSSSSAIPTLAMASNNITTRAKPTSGNPGATTTNNLKRSREEQDIDEEDAEATDQPRKLPAFSSGLQRPGMNGPLRPSRTAVNLANTKAAGNGSQMLSKSTTAPKGRATSAPPKGPIGMRTAVGLGASTSRARLPQGRSVSGGVSRPGDHKLEALHEQVMSMETARAADIARLENEMEMERTKVMELQTNHLNLERNLASARVQELAQKRELNSAADELEALKRKYASETEDLGADNRRKDRELRELREDLRVARADLERERESVQALKSTVESQSTAHITLTAQNTALQTQLTALRSSLDYSSADASNMRLDLETLRKRNTELEGELQEAEMIRRKLHNTVQELKGNIRVFCRVRPMLPSDIPPELSLSLNGSPSLALKSNTEESRQIKEQCLAQIDYPDQRDHKEIILKASSESAMGQERKETWNFTFDRVFEPESTQSDVFEDISQLAQSCTDGYNVCVFAYGQTGSGKSFTMEGGSTEETAGMIPRAVEQVFRAAGHMKSKGWEYKLEGQFLEIYNETINDLLGKGEFDKKKHEIKHDKGSTRVTDVVVVPLKSPSQVRTLLTMAQSRRTVASTLMNERSSRSHSVFTLRISGSNVHSGESCEGSLNLVDLAGSERLNSSGAGNDKDRLKETQNINRSLSALADVIAALGEKGEKADKHIPYRNSKLTYLLQNSLSGNSKTLMVLNLSPLGTHLGESLCSLRFATKVNNTTIGTAKRTTRVSS